MSMYNEKNKYDFKKLKCITKNYIYIKSNTKMGMSVCVNEMY